MSAPNLLRNAINYLLNPLLLILEHLYRFLEVRLVLPMDLALAFLPNRLGRLVPREALLAGMMKLLFSVPNQHTQW